MISTRPRSPSAFVAFKGRPYGITLLNRPGVSGVLRV
jgi:hypothetical protein